MRILKRFAKLFNKAASTRNTTKIIAEISCHNLFNALNVTLRIRIENLSIRMRGQNYYKGLMKALSTDGLYKLHRRALDIFFERFYCKIF